MFAISNKPPDPELPTFRLGHYWYQIRNKLVHFYYGINYETDWDAWQPVTFTDEEHAQEFLHELFRSAENADEVRQFILYHDPEKIVDTTFGFTDDDHLIEIIAAKVMLGELSLHRFHKVPFVYPYPNSEYLKPPLPWKPPSTWIAIQIVYDDTGEPVPNLPIVLQDSQTQGNQYRTDSNGIIKVKPIEPGACEVRCSFQGVTYRDCVEYVGTGEEPIQAKKTNSSRDDNQAKPPLCIAQVESRKVKTGDSLESLAIAAGMKPLDLAFFNFGTKSPEEINQHLADEVGCTKTTVDGKNYVFDSSDNPGIIFVPKPWKLPGLGSSLKHVIRVRPIAGPSGVRVRLHVVPEYAASLQEKLCLCRSDGSAKHERAICDSGDPSASDFVDIEFFGCPPQLDYALEIGSDGSEPRQFFKDKPYKEIDGHRDEDAAEENQEQVADEPELEPGIDAD